MILETQTQIDFDGKIVLDSLPEPTRNQMVTLAKARSIEWIVDGDAYRLTLESDFILSHWTGFDIETQLWRSPRVPSGKQ